MYKRWCLWTVRGLRFHDHRDEMAGERGFTILCAQKWICEQWSGCEPMSHINGVCEQYGQSWLFFGGLVLSLFCGFAHATPILFSVSFSLGLDPVGASSPSKVTDSFIWMPTPCTPPIISETSASLVTSGCSLNDRSYHDGADPLGARWGSTKLSKLLTAEVSNKEPPGLYLACRRFCLGCKESQNTQSLLQTIQVWEISIESLDFWLLLRSRNTRKFSVAHLSGDWLGTEPQLRLQTGHLLFSLQPLPKSFPVPISPLSCPP